MMHRVRPSQFRRSSRKNFRIDHAEERYWIGIVISIGLLVIVGASFVFIFVSLRRLPAIQKPAETHLNQAITQYIDEAPESTDLKVDPTILAQRITDDLHTYADLLTADIFELKGFNTDAIYPTILIASPDTKTCFSDKNLKNDADRAAFFGIFICILSDNADSSQNAPMWYDHSQRTIMVRPVGWPEPFLGAHLFYLIGRALRELAVDQNRFEIQKESHILSMVIINAATKSQYGAYLEHMLASLNIASFHELTAVLPLEDIEMLGILIGCDPDACDRQTRKAAIEMILFHLNIQHTLMILNRQDAWLQNLLLDLHPVSPKLK